MLEALIDPCGAAVCGEDDEGDEDEAEQKGEQVFAGEEFHWVGGEQLVVDGW